MFTLSRDVFLDYLKRGVNFELEDSTVVADYAYTFHFDQTPPSAKTGLVDFCVNDEKRFSDEESLLSYLKIGDVVSVRTMDGFDSLEAYEEAYRFQAADMEYLLKKYEDCDVFSLSCDTEEDCLVTEAERKKAFDDFVTSRKDQLRKLFISHVSEMQNKDFDAVYEAIEGECATFIERHKKEYEWERKEFGEDYVRTSFIADFVGRDTAFSEPQEVFWEFYHDVGMVFDVKKELEKFSTGEERLSPKEKLELFPELKPLFIRYEVAFGDHCTLCDRLMTTYYFKLNEKSKEWLLTHKNDYDFTPEMWDLAFYKGDEIRFESVTHEECHWDVGQNG